MTDNEFIEIVKDIRTLFAMPDFLEDADDRDLDTWFDIFGKMDFEKTRAAVRKTSLRKIFKYNLIAEIREDYDAITREEDVVNRKIEDCYKNLVSDFGTEARDAFYEIIESDTQEKRLQKARWLMNAGLRESESDPSLTLEKFLKEVIK